MQVVIVMHQRVRRHSEIIAVGNIACLGKEKRMLDLVLEFEFLDFSRAWPAL